MSQMTAFLHQLSEERFRLSTLGLFDIGLHLIPTVHYKMNVNVLEYVYLDIFII